jgi:hypothetical protein
MQLVNLPWRCPLDEDPQSDLSL